MKDSKFNYKYSDIGIMMIALFPLTSLLQEIPYLGLLNKIVVFVILFCLGNLLYKKTCAKFLIQSFAVLFICVFSIITKVIQGNTNEINSSVYYIFTFLLVSFYVYKSDNIIRIWKKNRNFIDNVIVMWDILVIISMVLPSSWRVVGDTWGSGRYFFSYTESGGARLGTIAFCVMVFCELQWVLYRSRKYIVWAIIPCLTSVLSGNRTGTLMIVATLIVFFYAKTKKKSTFFVTCIFAIPLIVLFLVNSSFGRKTMMALQTGYATNFIDLITNHRLEFINNAIVAFRSNSIFNQVLGGCNFSVECYDDFTNILLNFGVVGIIVYISIIVKFLSKISKNNNPWYINLLLYLCLVIALLTQMFYKFTNQTIGIVLFGMILTFIPSLKIETMKLSKK